MFRHNLIPVTFHPITYVKLGMEEGINMIKLKQVNIGSCTCISHGIFSDLDLNHLELVRKFKVMNHYKKGQTLFTEGSPNLGLYCINSGKIKVSRDAPDGKETILRIVGSGDLLGHQNLLANEMNANTATMIEDGSVCFVERKFINELLRTETTVALNIIRKLSAEMNASENRNAGLSNKNVRERLAELLLSLKNSYGIPEAHRTRLDIKLTREEMASLVGTANETIIRFISEFKDEGILEQEGKIIFLLDHDKLLKTAKFLKD
jgi:CRP-like cAMP-binding protein